MLIPQLCYCQLTIGIESSNTAVGTDFSQFKTHIEMSYNSSANVLVTNNTGANACIHLSHRYSSDSPQTRMWNHVQAGKAGEPALQVGFNTGFIHAGLDYWWVGVEILDGPNAGFYVSPGTADDPGKECMLESDDNGKTLVFSVSVDTFQMNLVSGGCSTSMRKVNRKEALFSRQGEGKDRD